MVNRAGMRQKPAAGLAQQTLARDPIKHGGGTRIQGGSDYGASRPLQLSRTSVNGVWNDQTIADQGGLRMTVECVATCSQGEGAKDR